MDIQAKLFFELVDKDGNGHISKVKMSGAKIWGQVGLVNKLKVKIKCKWAISDWDETVSCNSSFEKNWRFPKSFRSRRTWRRYAKNLQG